MLLILVLPSRISSAGSFDILILFLTFLLIVLVGSFEFPAERLQNIFLFLLLSFTAACSPRMLSRQLLKIIRPSKPNQMAVQRQLLLRRLLMLDFSFM